MIFLLLLTLFAPQDYQYGKPTDLKGLRRIYVDTEADLKSRNKIIDKLTKANLDLVFVDDADEAQIVITYRSGSDYRTVGIPTRNGTMIGTPEYPYGYGAVLVATPDKPKLVFTFKDQQNTAFEKAPLTNFMKELVKLFQENH